MIHDDVVIYGVSDMLRVLGAEDEKGASVAFYEDNECGAELEFTDVGVAVVLSAVDSAGSLLPLWTHRERYPFDESALRDAVDRLDRMFERAAEARGLTRDELHELTERAKR